MNNIHLIIVDDHPLVRDGIKAMLSFSKNIDVIGAAANMDELLLLITRKAPHIILLDISLPNTSGIIICEYLSTHFPEIKVIILSMHIKEDYIFNAIQAGAKGYLPKTTSKEELILAIEEVNNNGEYFSKQISDIILKSYIHKVRETDSESDSAEKQLTKRELEILCHVARGKTNQEIAEKLFISVRTVESHKTHIMQKLNLKTTVDLVHFALKNKIIEL